MSFCTKNKKEPSQLSDAFTLKRVERITSDQADFKTFAVGFESDDVQISCHGNVAKVTAHVSKEQFDKIINSNIVYIWEYLKDHCV